MIEIFGKRIAKKNAIIGLVILGAIILGLGLAIGIPLNSNLEKANKLLDKYLLLDGYKIEIFLFHKIENYMLYLKFKATTICPI